jgi:hypothetical protein
MSTGEAPASAGAASTSAASTGAGATVAEEEGDIPSRPSTGKPLAARTHFPSIPQLAIIPFSPRQVPPQRGQQTPTLPPRKSLQGPPPTRPPRRHKRSPPRARPRAPARGAVTILTALVPQERQALHRPPSPQPAQSKHQLLPRPRQADTSRPATTSSSTSRGRQVPERQLKGKSLTRTHSPPLGLRLLTNQAPAATNLKRCSSSRR